jgi:hypothetical protein
MNTTTQRGAGAALLSALDAALQWRVLLWWLLALALPTLIAALPVWGTLQSQFALVPQAPAIAADGNLPLLLEGLMAMKEAFGGIAFGVLVSVLMTLLLSPWLVGMVIASLRAGRRLGMGELLKGGFAEYGRMLRMLLWSIIPLGIACAIGGGLSAALHKQAETAVLASEVARAGTIGMVVLGVLALFAHMTLEAGRGWLGADAGLHSVLRAWWRGTMLVLRRPLASLVVYLGTAIVGYGLALLFAWLRLQIDGAGIATVMFGVLLTQCVVAMIAYARIARLHGFAALAADAIEQRERANAAAVDEPVHMPPAEAATA